MKKVAVNTARAFLKEHKDDDEITVSLTVEETPFEVKVRTTLSPSERAVFVRRVVSGCFDSNGDYRPEYKEPMIHATVIQMCTNLPVLSLKGEKSEDGADLMDVDAMDALYRAAKLDDVLCGVAYQLEYQCDEALEWRRNAAVREFSAMAKSIKELVDGIAKTADMSQLMEYAGQLSKATEGLDTKNLLTLLANNKE